MKLFKNNRLVWSVLCGGYMLFIAAFSVMYPYGMDEFLGSNFSAANSLKIALMMFMHHTAKTGLWLGSFILYFGKWLFIVLNPFVQLGIVLGMFYFIHLRLPDFKKTKDAGIFLLLALLSLCAVAVPDSTLFWLGGAVNYSWMFLVFIVYACLLRGFYEGKIVIKDSILTAVIAVIFGLALGMSNENNGPMALLISACFFIFAGIIKKRKLPKVFYINMAAMFVGAGILLLGPASRERMSISALGFSAPVLLDKMFFHINHLDSFIKANLLLPVINFLALLILGIDWDKAAFKNKDYVTALLCYVTSWILAFVLFAAPDVGWRPYYSATAFSIVTFVLLLKYLAEEYKLNFARYITMAVFIFCVVIFPLVAMPYVSLCRQAMNRNKTFNEAAKRGDKTIYLPFYMVERGPLANYTIIFFDVMFVSPSQRYFYFRRNIEPVKVLPYLHDDINKITPVY